jgi:hypothetical protein
MQGMEGEMLKGHLDMIVLAALSAGPAHGYAVIEEIKRKSGQAFHLPEGTIYPALHRLEQAGLLVSRWVTAESGRRRRGPDGASARSPNGGPSGSSSLLPLAVSLQEPGRTGGRRDF